MTIDNKSPIGVPLRTGRAVLIGDCITIIVLIAVGVILAVLLGQEPNQLRLSYSVTLVPLFFVAATIRRLYLHMQVGGITLLDKGVEISTKQGKRLIGWKEIKCVTRKHGYYAGLVLRLEAAEHLFIPTGVRNYAAVQTHILQSIGSTAIP